MSSFATAPKASAPQNAWTTRPNISEHKKILVLEDDVCLQPVISRIIKSIDPKIDISWATDLSSAFETLEESEDSNDLHPKTPFSLILSDIFLPNMENGMKLWNYCQKQGNKIPFAFMSSYSVDEYLKLFQGLKAPPYIPKPFRTMDCRQVLRSLF